MGGGQNKKGALRSALGQNNGISWDIANVTFE